MRIWYAVLSLAMYFARPSCSVPIPPSCSRTAIPTIIRMKLAASVTVDMRRANLTLLRQSHADFSAGLSWTDSCEELGSAGDTILYRRRCLRSHCLFM